MNTLEFYQFKQWFDTKEGKKLGNTYAFGNMTFSSPTEAIEYLKSQIESHHIHRDNVQSWELVKIVQDIIPSAIEKYSELETYEDVDLYPKM